MLTRVVVAIIEFCLRHARSVVALGVLLAIGGGLYTATHFVINSDINALLSSDLDWRAREVVFESQFRRYELLDVVVTAPTPELTAAATTALTRALAKETSSFQSVTNSSAAEFFAQHFMLFPPKDQIEKSLAGLTLGEPLIQDLAADESLRGIISGVEDVLLGVRQNKTTLDQVRRAFDMASVTLENVLAGRPASFSWRALLEGNTPSYELRGFIEVRPVLDYAAIQPGHAASEKLRRIAASVAPEYQATVRLTGPVAMADEEFGTIKENATRNGLITFAIVLFILWLALRSPRLISAVFINLMIGLPITAALGLLLVGSFNLISVYFAVLFVGIGVDFAIQYSVRYRAERHESADLPRAVRRAGFHVAAPLTLAGCATAAGFLSFVPTDYKGVSELGLIAGFGMLIAFATSVTILPALIVLLNPPGEPEPMGFSALAPIDNYLDRHRVAVLLGVAAVVVCGLPLLLWLRFDFNPINLRDPTTESIATYLELNRDPTTNANAIELLAPNLDAAQQIAERLSKLPEVSHAMTSPASSPTNNRRSCRSSWRRRRLWGACLIRRTPLRRRQTRTTSKP